MYGREVILDVVDCDVSTFTRVKIESFFVRLCGLLRLKRAGLHWWDYDDLDERAEAPDHLAGVSAVQFVATSSIVIHTLDSTREVMLNVFACGEVDAEIVQQLAAECFGGRVASCHSIQRGGTGLLEKLPTPQRLAPNELEALTQMLFESPHDVETLSVGQVLDAVTDLRDLRNAMDGPIDDPEERVRWHLEQLAEEWCKVRQGVAESTS